MTTLVVLSDLHIGPSDSPHRFFRGEGALAEALEKLAAEHTSDLHLVLNGDTLDFLMASGVTSFDEGAALRALDAILAGADGRALVRGLNSVLEVGGRVTVRLGNHDPELKNAAVRGRFRRALTGDVSWDEAPSRRELVGGVPVTIEHGEAPDLFNAFDYGRAGTREFTYPPGSLVVVNLLQRIRIKHKLGFLDALKPDFHGAVVAALLLRPSVAREIFTSGAGKVLLRLAEWKVKGPLGLAETGESLEAVYQAIEAARRAPAGLVDDDVEGADDGAAPTPERSRALIFKVTPWIRRFARDGGAEFFDLTPPTEELDAVHQELPAGPSVLVRGHSHAARFWSDGTRAYLNTGTWGALMKLPGPQEDEGAWSNFYTELREKPDLTEKNTYTFFSAARIQETPAGAQVDLIRWEKGAWTLAGHTTTGVTLRPDEVGAPRALLDLGRSDTTKQEEAVTAELARVREGLGRRQPTPAFVRNAIADRAQAELGAKGVRNAAALLDLLRQLDEQRRNPAHLDVLRAADRIGRAMHDWVLQAARQGEAGAEPLPPVSWLESVASPVTWNRQEGVPAPGLLNRGYINLPFPIVIVPTDHLDRPWRLLSVLHEVGHNLDHFLGFSAALKRELPGSPWDPWAEEIVADVLAARAAGLPYVQVLDWIIRGIHAGELPKRDGLRYPPPRLRLALLERVAGQEGRFSADCREAPELRPLLDAFDAVRYGATITRLYSLTQGETPAILLLPAAFVPAHRDEPPPSVDDRRALRARLARIEPPADTLTEAQTSFLQGQHTRFAPASIDATGSLLKTPRADLMLEADHMWFVGATHENLLKTLRDALAARKGRPWRSIEVFFVGRDEDLGALYPGLPDDQCVVRRAARAALVEALRTEGIAEAWRVFEPTPGQLYASFYLKRDVGYPDSWYAHTSAPVWGKGIRSAPSTDYQSVSRDLRGDPEIRFLVEGLEHLRGRPVSAESAAPCLNTLLPPE